MLEKMDHQLLNYNGTIHIDRGAAKALSNGKSLLAAGITKINGNFKGENVIILDQGKFSLLEDYHLLAQLK